MSVKEKELSAKQKRFCQLWVIDFDYGQAWLNAGYKPKSKEVARVNAARFVLQNATAQKYIQHLLHKQIIRSEKTADDIIREFELVGFSNIQDFVGTDKDGEFIFKSWDTLTREQLAAVESVKMTRNTIRNTKKDDDNEYTTTHIQLKLHSKLTALEALAKRYKLLVARVEHSGSIDHNVHADALAAMPTEQLMLLRNRLLKASGSNGDKDKLHTTASTGRSAIEN